MSVNSNVNQYVVRGALLKCECGTHPRRLNLPWSHGIYIREHPMIKIDDCTSRNISYFGICRGKTPPQNSPQINLVAYGEDANSADAKVVHGCQCWPSIVGQWKNVNGGTVTTDSYLVCAHGGIITPITSGLEYKD